MLGRCGQTIRDRLRPFFSSVYFISYSGNVWFSVVNWGWVKALFQRERLS